MMRTYLFTSESVSEGHPDKVADRISDAINDAYLALDPTAHVACETLVTTNKVVIAGEIKSKVSLDIESIVRQTIAEIGYTNPELMFDATTCHIDIALHAQSEDIDQGVSRSLPEQQGAGDQGMMFGYATIESSNYIPLTLDIAHTIMRALAEARHSGRIPYLRPDAKAQVTIEYDIWNFPKRIDTIVISTQHDEGITRKRIIRDMTSLLLEIGAEEPYLMEMFNRFIHELEDHRAKFLINPTGKFVIGGPHGDTGLTGRKIIVDTYGGRGAHGGGAFSGKDPSKVDRSAAYMARYIAKNLVAAGIAREALVQIAYAIGVAKPVSFCVNTYGTSEIPDSEIAKGLLKVFDLRPHAISEALHLTDPIYKETSAYGHFGRMPEQVTKSFTAEDGTTFTRSVELFPWEKLDRIEDIRQALLN